MIVVTPYLVNPVNANDIKLPTDGFNSANELQRILGNQMNAPGSPDRPKPTSAPDPAAPAGPTPGVGLIGPMITPGQVAAQAQLQARDDTDKRKNRNNRKTAGSDVGPGFSLN